MTDQTVPMMTTNNIAVSVWPNHSSASGTQHTLGRVCKPERQHAQRVLARALNRAVSKPSGSPNAKPSA